MANLQTTDTILMVRPVKFSLNEQTAVNNYYQKSLDMSATEIQESALREFDDFVAKLKNKGVEVIVINDTASPETPDSIFPNNWVSFHEGGKIVLYPMFSPARRDERRDDLLTEVSKEAGFGISDKIDLTSSEERNLFLEGTGSMVLDRANKIAYAALSGRTHEEVLEQFCDKLGYEAVTFTAYQTAEGQRLPIYHTNVMMSVGETFAIICLECIDDTTERARVEDRLHATGKEVIAITESQTDQFAGNMLEVCSTTGSRYLVMSSAAYHSLTPGQIEKIEKHCEIIHSSLTVIETLGGGSARCMMAEVFHQ